MTGKQLPQEQRGGAGSPSRPWLLALGLPAQPESSPPSPGKHSAQSSCGRGSPGLCSPGCVPGTGQWPGLAWPRAVPSSCTEGGTLQPWPHLSLAKSLGWGWLSLGVTLPPGHTGPIWGHLQLSWGMLLASSKWLQGGCSVPTEPWMAPRVTCPLSTVPKRRQTLCSLFIKNPT